MTLQAIAGRVIEGGLGLYLLLPSIEDAATGGITLIPSAAIGGTMLLHAFGIDISKVLK